MMLVLECYVTLRMNGRYRGRLGDGGGDGDGVGGGGERALDTAHEHMIGP